MYKLYPGPSIDRDVQVPDLIVDSTRAELILTYNSFSGFDERDLFDPIKSKLLANKQSFKIFSGLWIFPSYFNHSCIANTTRFFLKDLALFYASRDIEEGEELTAQYCDALDAYDDRVKTCSQYNFQCDCRLCELDQNDQNRKIRTYYFNYFLVNLKNSNFDKLDFYQKFKETYSNRNELQLDLIHPLQAMILYYKQQNDFKKAGDVFMEIYELVRDFGSFINACILFHAIEFFTSVYLMDEAKRFYTFAKKEFVGHPDYFDYLTRSKYTRFS